MKTFFAAEDDELMCHLYERAFRLAGHEIEIAHDGEEALAKLTQMSPKPAVVVLDVMMPKMNGFDVITKMKGDDTLKNIPVIMLTNLAGEEDMQKGLALGALEYLVKSDYNPGQIVEKVVALVEAQGSDSEKV
jgi:DNA-binding response OmpR family regulator